MQITDTIADMLTRIRNANSAKHDSVDIPASNKMCIRDRCGTSPGSKPLW